MNRSHVLAVLMLSLSLPAAAQTSLHSPDGQPTTRLIPVSGTLTVAPDPVPTGQLAVTFTLYDEQEGGSALWQETQQLQIDARGRYAAYLGVTTALPQEAFSQEKARWLGVDVEGRAQPRVMLVAVPYALRAVDADTLGGKPLSSFVQTDAQGRTVRADGTEIISAAVDGTGVPNQLAKWTGGTTQSSSIITESVTNRIGIGTTDPEEGGLLQSKLTIRSPDSLTAIAVANEVGVPRWALNTYADGSIITFDRATGSYLPGIVQRGGRIGVSAVDPTGGGVVDSKFTVRNLDNNTGIAVLNELNGRRFALNTQSNGGWLMYDGGGNTWNPGLFQQGGKVSVGTTTPWTFTYEVDVFSSTGNALWGRTSAAGFYAVVGDASNTGGAGNGVIGQSQSGVGLTGNSNTGRALAVSSGGPVIATFSGSGSVGIGTVGPADKLHVAGDIRVGTGTTGCVKDADATVIAGTCSSDRRLKKNITPFGSSLDKVTRLQPVHFYWRGDEFPEKHFGASESFGLIAQDVEAVLPELVTSDETGYKAVRYSALPLHILQALKDMKVENDALKVQVAAQEERLRRLESAIIK